MWHSIPLRLGLCSRWRGIGMLAPAILLASCAEPAGPLSTPLASPEPAAVSAQRSRSNRVDLAPLAAVHKARPADPEAAVAYAHALREAGSASKALTVLDKTAALKPADKRLLLERGLIDARSRRAGEGRGAAAQGAGQEDAGLARALGPRARRSRPAATSRRRRSSSPKRWRSRPIIQASSTISPCPTRSTARWRRPSSSCARRIKPRAKQGAWPTHARFSRTSRWCWACAAGTRRRASPPPTHSPPPRRKGTSPIYESWLARAPRQQAPSARPIQERKLPRAGPARACRNRSIASAVRRTDPRRRKKQKGPATLSAEPPWITPGKIEFQGALTLLAAP